MTDLLELTLIKQHIRTDRDDEDDYLKVLAGASVEAFQDFTNRTLVDGDTLPEDLVDDEVPMNLTIQQGLLLLIGHWYENREMVTLVDQVVAEAIQVVAVEQVILLQLYHHKETMVPE